MNRYFFAIILCLVGVNVGADQVIKHNKIESEKDSYPLGLLQLALSYDETEKYTYAPIAEMLPQSRLTDELEHGGVDVAWFAASEALEQQFFPIRIPIFKGLLGYRIFIIRKGDQKRFSNIETFSDLQKLKAGQGTFWPDTKILKSAGLPVVTTVRYENLFHMLDGGRFEYFPRGVHEPWAEVDTYEGLQLQIEENILLVYPLPAYFFVKQGNDSLNKKIVSGLERAITDGSFDRYFNSSPMVKLLFEKAKLKKRLIFRIDNPNLSSETPFDDARLWLDI